MASRKSRQWKYQLERLYEDQDPGYAKDSIPHLLCWLDSQQQECEHRFQFREQLGEEHVDHELIVSWDVKRLARKDVELDAALRRYRSGKTLTLEDRTKYAAYALAMVAISCLLRRRVVGVSLFRPPDLLLDTTPGALHGVEVAGRTSKGFSAFAQAIKGTKRQPGKRGQLLASVDVAEAYLSLWCQDPKVAIWEKVKP